MWCQHLVINPGPNHTHTPFTSLFSPQVLLSSCCDPHSFWSSFLAFRQEANGLCDVKQAHKSGTSFLVLTLFLQPPLSSCHFASLMPLWCCDECGMPNSCSQWDQVMWVPSSLHCGAWCLWCGVLNHHCPFPFTHCIIHWLCHVWWLNDCMVLCCLAEWRLSALTATHKERKRTAHRHACVACCVCDGVVWSVSVGMWGVVWRIEGREMIVWKTQSHKKQKDALFPQITFPPSFPFISLFPSLSFHDSLPLYHHPLSITRSPSFPSTTHAHTHNEYNPKPTQHQIHFIVFLSYSFSFLSHLSTKSLLSHCKHSHNHTKSSNNNHSSHIR